MINRVELKTLSKNQLKGRWGGAILASFLVLVFSFIISGICQKIPNVGSLIGAILTAPFAIGSWIYYLNLVKTDDKVNINNIFKGFDILGKSLGIYIWYMLWIMLWSLLLLIPGIIKSLAYSQAMIIIADNPNVKVRDALKISMKMTDGYKADIFVMYLSFLGWMLLCLLTFGIGFLWFQPYIITTYTKMFHKLKEISIEKGVCSEEDFSGKKISNPHPRPFSQHWEKGEKRNLN